MTLALPLIFALAAAPAARPEPTQAQVEGWLQQLRGAPAPNSNLRLKSRSATIPKAKGDVRDVYSKVAPGTVLIRSIT